jgi:hypothetical protein
MIESPTDSDSAAKRATNGRASAPPDELAGFLERNADRLGGLLGDLRILGSVEADRARLRLRRVLARTQILVALSIGATVWIAAGAVLVALGLDGALRALFADRPWLGDLVAGFALLASLATLWLVARAARNSAAAGRLERKYAELERDGAPH